MLMLINAVIHVLCSLDCYFTLGFFEEVSEQINTNRHIENFDIKNTVTESMGM